MHHEEVRGLLISDSIPLTHEHSVVDHYSVVYVIISCFRYQQDRYFTVATKRWMLPAELRPAPDKPFFPKGYVIYNTPEQCTVLLSHPVGRPSLVDTLAFDYGPVLADCLLALPDDSSAEPKKQRWRVFLKDRDHRRSQAALVPAALPSRQVRPLAAAQREPLAFHGAASVPVVEQPLTISSSLNPRPEGQTQPAQERADERGAALVGRRVCKYFPEWGKHYEGRITAYLSPQETHRAGSLWRVVYDSDSSVEEYPLGALNKIILPITVRTEGGGGSSSSSPSSSSSSSMSSSAPSSSSALRPRSRASSKETACRPPLSEKAEGKAAKKKKKKKKDSGSDSDSDSNSSDSDGAVIACRQCSHGRKCRLQGSPGHLRGY